MKMVNTRQRTEPCGVQLNKASFGAYVIFRIKWSMVCGILFRHALAHNTDVDALFGVLISKNNDKIELENEVDGE